MVAKILLLAHAVAAGVLTGALTHLAIVVAGARWKRRANPRLVRLYPAVALAAFVAVTGLGAVLYPGYRVAVRAGYLESHARWAAVLFDVKENLAVLLAPLLLAAWLVTRGARADAEARQPSTVLLVSVLCTAMGVWFNLVAGLLVVSVRSV